MRVTHPINPIPKLSPATRKTILIVNLTLSRVLAL